MTSTRAGTAPPTCPCPVRPAPAARDRRAARRRPPDRRRAVHVHARRRAPLRHAADADRGAQLRRRAGEQLVVVDVALRHPEPRQGHDERARRSAARQLRDLDLRRRDGPDLQRHPTGSAPSDRSGGAVGVSGPEATRPARHVTGLRARSPPLPMETLPETFVHPAGYCQNVLVDRATAGSSGSRGRRPRGVVVECDHPRTIEMAADRPDFRIRIAVDRADGVDPPPRGVDRRRRDPRRPGHRATRRTRRSARPPSTSCSRPGRRCSTDRRSGAARRRRESERPAGGRAFVCFEEGGRQAPASSSPVRSRPALPPFPGPSAP